MKFAMCNELYGNKDIFQVIDGRATLGYDGLELAPFTLTEDVTTCAVKDQQGLARPSRGPLTSS